MAKVKIDAHRAMELLKNNKHNRKVTQSRVDEYAKEMISNMWLYNGETIVISESGRLLDGQHRLLAIVKADAVIEVELIEGVKDEQDGVDTFLTINTKNRSNVDALTIAGFTQSVPQIAKLMSFKEAFDNKILMKKSSGVKLLNHEVVELAREFGEENATLIIDRARNLEKRNDLLSLPYWILLVYVFNQITDGNQFLEELAESSGGKNNAIEAYITQLEKFRELKLGGNEVTKFKFNGAFRAYNANRNGTDIKIMRQSSKAPLEYPENYPSYCE